MSTAPRHPVVGAISALAGIGVALLVHLQPEKLRAPAWVAYAAAGAFFLAGVSMLAQAHGAPRRWLAWIALAVLACLLTPLAWIVVANPDGHCRANLLGWWIEAPAWSCRGGLAVALVVGLLMLVWAVRHALRPPP